MQTGPAARLEGDGALMVLTLDSPPLNLFDRAMIETLGTLTEELSAAPPRGLLIRAEGRAVSGGVDVNVFAGIRPADAERLFRELLAITRAVEALPCPTVFAAHALTLTAAFEISLACDLIVASREARFGLVEAVVGITPAMGGTQRLAERAGHGRARELVMTGDLYDAETLHAWNVVNFIYDEDLEEASRALALRLAEGPTRAHKVTKDILRAYLDGGTPMADRITAAAVGALFDSQDHRGAVESFLSKGPGNARFAGV